MTCAECGGEFPIPKDVEVGELVACPDCAVEYEVMSLEPLVVEIFEEDEK